jgi:predicted peptidase
MTLDPYVVTRRMLRTALSVCVFLIPCGSVAQPEIIAKFLSRAHTFHDATLVYRLFVPEGYTPSKRYPIVLALHGNGAQGSDNLIHIQGTRLATSWADPINQTKYPCFVVAPQCRAGHFWVEDEGLSSDLATANNILDSLAQEFTIDTTRMYVTGLSMGGYATWHLATLFPERFAAAIPVSAGWWTVDPSRIVLMPIWTFMGTQDALVPVATVRVIIDGFRQCGRSVVYTRCNGGDCTGLSDSVIAAYVRNHADLFYTEIPYGQHDGAFFDFAYDYPFLRSWVFDKIRLTRGSVTLNNLKSFQTLRSVESITWATSTTLVSRLRDMLSKSHDFLKD